MNKTNGSKAKKKPQQDNSHAGAQPPQPQMNQWDRVPGEPGERSDKESIGRPVQLDEEHPEQPGQARPGHGEHSSPAHADKSRI